MNEVLLILGMMIVTFGARYPVLVLVGRIPLPPAIFRALRYVPVAVLVAIIAPSMTLTGGQLDLSPANAYWVGGLIAIAIAWRTRSMLTTIVGGLAFFLIWRALTGAMV